MNREKQIEEMARKNCHIEYHMKNYKTCKECYETNYCACRVYEICRNLYDAGYRKQSEGEWVKSPCYIGQEIWYIAKYYDGRIEIGRGKVSMLQQKADKSWKIRITVNSSVWDFTPNEIGTIYFFSKEEAEAALKGGEG